MWRKVKIRKIILLSFFTAILLTLAVQFINYSPVSAASTSSYQFNYVYLLGALNICQQPSSSTTPCSQDISNFGKQNSDIILYTNSAKNSFQLVDFNTSNLVSITVGNNCAQGVVQDDKGYKTNIAIGNSVLLGSLSGSQKKNLSCSNSKPSQPSTAAQTVQSITSLAPTAVPPATTTTDPPTCESTGGPFSWFTCKVIDGLQGVERSVEKVIGNLLATRPLKTSCVPGDNSCDAYNAWSNFRIYGNIVLVIALLIMVFAEIFGGGVVEAYNLKKMLPRILAAAILINLSFYIVAALEDITNVVGGGVYDLLSAPFKNAGLAINIHGGQGDLFVIGGATGGLLGILAAHSFWAAGGLAGIGDAAGFLILMVVLPAVMAILGVLLTIFFRQAILVLLVVVSPVAFALWCLPNTEQYFRKWWDFLFKTLLVYPIVMVIFAMCYIGAIVMSSFNIEGGDWIGELMSIIAVVAPLFLVPFAFKISGGVTGQIHETLSGLGKRATGAIQGDVKNPNSLQNRVRSRFTNRRSEAGLTGAQANEMLGGFLPGRKNVYTRAGREKMREALADRRASARDEHGAAYLEHDAIWQANKEDSKFLLAHANRQLAERRRNDALAKGDNTTAEQWSRALNTADMVHRDQSTRMASAQAWLASGYDLNEDGQQAYNEMAQTFADITGSTYNPHAAPGETVFSGSNTGAAVNAMNTAQSAMARNGQFHLAGINYGTGYNPDMGLGKADPFTWGRGKPGSSTGAKDSALEHIAAGTDEDLIKASVYKQELASLAQNSTGAQRDEALKAVQALSDSTPHITAGMTPAEVAKETARANAAGALGAWEGANVLAPGGGPVVKGRQRLNLDRDYGGNAANAVADGWTPADMALGWRDVNRTNRDRAADQARTARMPREDET